MRNKIISLLQLPLAIACVFSVNMYAQDSTTSISIKISGLNKIATIDKRFQSFNIEMVEVVGGNFWIPYAIMDSTRKLAADSNTNVGVSKNLYRAVPPVDLTDKKLRMLAAALGPVYMRVSGSWANSIYFQDNDEAKMLTAPDGFKNILTRAAWKGVINFATVIDAKLVTSFAISDGVRDKDGIWTPVQAMALVNYTKTIGGNIAAAELFNEPTYASHAGGPKGYNAGTFAKDVAVFSDFVKKNLPGMIMLGPGGIGEGGIFPGGAGNYKN